jgi:hypothetical protein
MHCDENTLAANLTCGAHRSPAPPQQPRITSQVAAAPIKAASRARPPAGAALKTGWGDRLNIQGHIPSIDWNSAQKSFEERTVIVYAIFNDVCSSYLRRHC